MSSLKNEKQDFNLYQFLKMATPSNTILLYALNKEGKPNFLMTRLNPEREACYYLVPLAEWSTQRGQLALYRICISASKLRSCQPETDFPLFCVGKAGQEDEEPDFDNKEIWSFIFTCSMSNPNDIYIHDLSSDKKQVFLENVLENRHLLNYSKLIDFCLKTTAADFDSVVHDAKGQELANIFQ